MIHLRTRPFIAALALVALAACGSDRDDDDDTPPKATTIPAKVRLVVELSEPTSGGAIDWPESFAPLAPCTPPAGGFSLAKPAKQKGEVQLFASAIATPAGEVEDVRVVVTKADGSADNSLSAAPVVEVGDGVELVSAGVFDGGTAHLRVRVLSAGEHALGVTLADGRKGSVKLVGYTPHLPILRVNVAQADLNDVLAHPNDDIWADVTIETEGQSLPAKMRLHGGSSRHYSKESFRFDMGKGATLPDGRRKFVLRAEYVDKTLLRNWLTLDLLRSATTLPTSDSRFVHLRVNDGYWGVMHDVERVDRDFLSRRGLEAHGSLYEADPPLEFANPGGNLTPLESLERYRTVYQHHAGPWAHDDLIVLIEDILQREDDALAADIDKIVAVDDVLIYLAVMAVVQNQDMVRKNYYLHHAVDAPDKRWRVIPWDLDLSWGHLWSEENDILEEKIVSDGDLFVGTYQGHSFYNQLIERLLTMPTWRARYLAFVQHLIEGPVDEAKLGARIETMICHLGYDLLADPQKRASNDELAQRFGELADFLADRRAFLAKTIAEQP